MRLRLDSPLDEQADHLCRLHDLGVDTHHSSHEYDSHSAYLAALAKAQQSGRSFHHIVKLAEPGFDDHRFNPARLTALLDQQLEDLNAETIASVQWLFRTPDPQNDSARIPTVADQIGEITAWASHQIDVGKMQNLSFFPYSTPFAETLMDLGLSATPTMYLNLLELESVNLLGRSDGFIAIRPLAGGRLVDPSSPDRLSDTIDVRDSEGNLMTAAAVALRFTLLHPGVTTSVLSVNSADHLDQLLVAMATEADPEAFNDLLPAGRAG